MRRLEADGTIRGYTAVLDREAVGCAYEPIVWVTLTSVTRESMLDFEQAIQAIPAIVEAARMMGQPDYLLRVVAADADAFEALYMDDLASLPHVQTLTSQLAMKVVKRTTRVADRCDRFGSSPAQLGDEFEPLVEPSGLAPDHLLHRSAEPGQLELHPGRRRCSAARSSRRRSGSPWTTRPFVPR